MRGSTSSSTRWTSTGAGSRRPGALHERRLHRAADEVESIALTALRERVGDLRSRGGEHGLDELAADVVAGRTDPYAAADRLLAGLTGG